MFDGFTSLEGGMDADSAPSLLQPNQSAFLGNVSLRGDYASSRSPFIRKILSFDSATTQSHFAGMFQGACFYEADDETMNSLIVSISGRLFRIYVYNNFLVEEITPGPAILVTVAFTVPAVGAQVTIDVSSEVPFSIGQDIVIDGGSYTVYAKLADQLVLFYNGGAANANGVINSTTPVLNSSSTQIYVTLPELVTAAFNVPATGQQVTAPVTSEVGFEVNQELVIDSGIYTIAQTAVGQLVLNYVGGAAHTSVSQGTNIYTPSLFSQSVTVIGDTAVPAVNGNVTFRVSSVTPFSVNQVILIGQGRYVINVIDSAFVLQLHTTYLGGAANSTIVAGTAIYNPTGTQINVTLPENVTADFTIPAINSNVTVHVTSDAGFTTSQLLTIAGVNFTVATVLTGQNMITATYTGGALYVSANDQISDSSSNPIYLDDTNPVDADFVFLYQGENYVIGLCENQGTLIFDGSNTRRANQAQNELPSSYVGVYAWGRNWLAQVNGHRFVASDLVGDPSGSPALVYVDAILKMTENDLLNGGGAFSTPSNLGTITAMSVLSQLDSSLGIGPILVGTEKSIFSVQAPVDRTTWQNLTYPIQSIALQGSGPVGPRSMITINSDAWFRSLDGIRSLIAARRDFQSNLSNTPQSIEMSPVLSSDDESLLFYNSMCNFDNRILSTVAPYQTFYGVAHRGLVVVNLDTVSGMFKKSVPVWEGLWTGLNVFQILSGNINGVEHCYLFVLNASNGIDLWELSPQSNDETYDVYDSVTDGVETLERTSIESWVDTRSMNFGDPFQLKKLIMAELYLDEIVDTVSIEIYFKPDQYPLWTPWTELEVCANVSQCSLDGTTCAVFQPEQKQYAARLTLPRPPETCNTITGKPMERGYEFQFRFEITGSCRIRKFKAHAVIDQDSMEGECAPESTTCKTLTGCPTSWFTYDAY